MWGLLACSFMKQGNLFFVGLIKFVSVLFSGAQRQISLFISNIVSQVKLERENVCFYVMCTRWFFSRFITQTWTHVCFVCLPRERKKESKNDLFSQHESQRKTKGFSGKNEIQSNFSKQKLLLYLCNSHATILRQRWFVFTFRSAVWNECVNIFSLSGMAAMPFLCRGVWFSPNFHVAIRWHKSEMGKRWHV